MSEILAETGLTAPSEIRYRSSRALLSQSTACSIFKIKPTAWNWKMSTLIYQPDVRDRRGHGVATASKGIELIVASSLTCR